MKYILIDFGDNEAYVFYSISVSTLLEIQRLMCSVVVGF